MRFKSTQFDGAWLIEPERIGDSRGFFARTWCEDEFRSRGLNPRVVQCNVSFNRAAGTLRGLHWQAEPHAEAKLVRCTAGAIYDVTVDLRPESPTFGIWQGVELTARAGNMLFVPEGLAHGFVTIFPETEVFYQMSEPYAAEYQRGLVWNDPLLNIDWKYSVHVISGRDAGLPDLTELNLQKATLRS